MLPSNDLELSQYVSLGIFAHYTVRNRVESLWRSVPRDAWDSNGAWMICVGLSVATIFTVPVSFLFEVPYRYIQETQAPQYQAHSGLAENNQISIQVEETHETSDAEISVRINRV